MNEVKGNPFHPLLRVTKRNRAYICKRYNNVLRPTLHMRTGYIGQFRFHE